jgi:DNA-binding transcriptional MerR regulator
MASLPDPVVRGRADLVTSVKDGREAPPEGAPPANGIADSPPAGFLTRTPAARRLGLSVSTVIRWEALGRLHPVIVNGKRHHDPAELDALRPSAASRPARPILPIDPLRRPPGLDAEVFRLLREKTSPQMIVEITKQPHEIVFALVGAYISGDAAVPYPDEIKESILEELRPEVKSAIQALYAQVKALRADVERAEQRLEEAHEALLRARFLLATEEK